LISETPARCGELYAELGHQRRPRFNEAYFGDWIPLASLRRTPDPASLGLAPTPVTGAIPTTWSHRPADAARRPSADELSRRGKGKSPRAHAGLDSRGDSPSRCCSPCGGRAHRFESPARRHGEVSEAPRLDRGRRLLEWGRGLDLVKLFGAARLDRAGTASVNHPGAAKNRSRGPGRLTDTNATRRSRQRRRVRSRFFHSSR
jgi:hypothetical protein